MAHVKSFEEKIKDVERVEIMVASLKATMLEALAYQEQEFEDGILIPNDFRVRIEAMLNGMAALTATTIPAALTIMTTELDIWQVRLSKDIFHDPQTWESVNVDVVSSDDAVLTINQTGTVDIFGTGTTVLIPADVIEITNAEDPKHNGRHTIKAAGVAAQVITLDSNMLGEDNANDETMVITLVER